MKKFIVLPFTAIMLFVASNVYALVGAPDATLAIVEQTLWQKARAALEDSSAYKQLVELQNSYNQLKQTYEENKQYYDYVKELNEYKGGIGHLVRDKIIDEMQNIVDYIQKAGQDRLNEITANIEDFSKVSISSYSEVADRLQKTLEKRLEEETAVSEIALKAAQEMKEAMDKLTALANETGADKMNEFSRRAQIETINAMNKVLEAVNTQRVSASVQKAAELKIEKTKSAKVIKSLLEYKRAKDKDPNYRSEEYFGGQAPVFIFGATKEDEEKAQAEKKAKTGDK
ncbi:MAG: hypothetical protein LBQ47_06900 [Endomicrobium sp.]|jgi:hypothetical protein|nr:hypothetical protein [Endomicrobium sp.]